MILCLGNILLVDVVNKHCYRKSHRVRKINSFPDAGVWMCTANSYQILFHRQTCEPMIPALLRLLSINYFTTVHSAKSPVVPKKKNTCWFQATNHCDPFYNYHCPKRTSNPSRSQQLNAIVVITFSLIALAP